MDAPVMLSLHVPDIRTLHLAYMPFLISGGLFIPTNDGYEMGDEVYLLLRLPDAPESMAVNGRVVWITPARAQAGLQQGIGLQFLERPSAMKAHIETLLTNNRSPEGRTWTL